MTLVDTSVWVEYLAGRGHRLTGLLDESLVCIHPFVIGEVACGNLRHRAMVLDALCRLPRVAQASHEEVIQLVAGRQLWGTGLGWIDAHLLASALLAGCGLYTFDERLKRTARALGVRTE